MTAAQARRIIPARQANIARGFIMTTVAVAHHPELTPEGALEVFRRHLDDRYDIHAATGVDKWFSGRPHIVVRKTRWAAVAVWLIQKKEATSFRFSGMQPPETVVGVVFAVVGLLIAYLIAWMTLRSSWKAIEADIASVLDSAPEFN